MLRLITFLTAVLLASAAAATTLYVEAPKDGYLNLRYGPSTAYTVIKKMPHGSTVQVIATPGKWYKVQDSFGATGWAHRAWLTHYPVQPLPQHPALPRDAYIVDAPQHGALNLRAGPGTSFHVITKMSHGSKVKVLSASGQWRLVEHQTGATGWAHSGYLTKKLYVTPRHSHHTHPAPNGYSSKNIATATKLCQTAPAHTMETCLAFSLNQLLR